MRTSEFLQSDSVRACYCLTRLQPLLYASNYFCVLSVTMAQQRKVWEADMDEDLQDVDLSLAIGPYAQSGNYDDGGHPMVSFAKGRY